MSKNKRIRILVIACFVVIAGILYTCSMLVQSEHETDMLEHTLSEHEIVQTSQLNEKSSKDPTQKEENVAKQSFDVKERENTRDLKENHLENSKENETTSQKIYVYLCGQVCEPGVYEVEVGTRLNQVVELAKGMTKDAAKDMVNLASLVEDGQRIYIPTMEEVSEQSKLGDLKQGSNTTTNEAKGYETSDKNNLVNINSASREELMTLSGIGEAKADKIIAYRKANGTFLAIEDIMNIPGIKKGLFQKICDQITVK